MKDLQLNADCMLLHISGLEPSFISYMVSGDDVLFVAINDGVENHFFTP